MNFLEQIASIIEQNNEYYNQQDIDKIQNITLVKNLEFEQKVEAIKFIIHNNPIDNASILNLKILLTGLGVIDATILKDTDVIWVNNLKELCDLTIALRQELEEISIKIFYAFIGIIKSLKITVNEATKTQQLTGMEDLLLRTLGFPGISMIMRKIQFSIDISEIPCYIEGKQVLFSMSNQMNIIELL